MPILPLMELGRQGVIRDVSPFTLDPTAWSNCSNVRFENGRVRRSQGFRLVDNTFTIDPQGTPVAVPNPQFAFGVRPSSGLDFIVLVADDGRQYTYDGTYSEVTPTSGFTASTISDKFTGTFLDDCVYVNRQDQVPFVLVPGAQNFVPLTDFNWPSTARANIVRSFRDSLIFLDVQVDGISRPTSVLFSDTVPGDRSPPTAYTAATDNNAGLTPLPDMQGRILDGQPLKSVFLIYSNTEVWRMRPVQSTDVYEFDKLFDDEGVIATNCVLQKDGLHYVFGEHDIYVTDGQTKRSILEDENGDSLNREFIYRTMIKEARQGFKVLEDPVRDDILFLYVTSDLEAAYPGTTFPNRAAVYNTRNKTWSFVDMPSIVGGAEIVFQNLIDWDDVTTTWNNTGGSWNGSSDANRVALFLVKREDTAATALPSGNAIYGYDLFGEGSTIPLPMDTSVINPAFVERIGIDLSSLGEQVRGYKHMRRFYPQARTFDDAVLRFTFGSHQAPYQNPTTVSETTFDPDTQNKVDFRKGGHYLTIRLQVDEPSDFWFSGGELDYVVQGRRAST